MITILDFCAKHDACKAFQAWAVANCKTMAEVWDTAKPEWLLWVATRDGVLTDRELRLLAVWAARQVEHLMHDARSIAVLDVAERHANGQATDKELAAARAAAWAAARDAAMAAAWASAWAAARDAAMAAARAAAWAAAWDAAWDVAWDVAKAKQAAWVRENCKPKFA